MLLASEGIELVANAQMSSSSPYSVEGPASKIEPLAIDVMLARSPSALAPSDNDQPNTSFKPLTERLPESPRWAMTMRWPSPTQLNRALASAELIAE